MIAKSATIPAPGIYHDMDDDVYRAIPAVSKSDLDKWALGREIDPRTALIGTAFHAAILEPEIAKGKIAVCEARRNSNAWKEFVEANPDKWVLTKKEYSTIVGMVGSVKEHPEVGKLREMGRANQKMTELVSIWQDEETGVMCKAKIDFASDNRIYDWKSTGSDREGFAKSIGAFGYHVQAAHYMEAWAAHHDALPFGFICCGKRADWQHPCWWFEIEEAWVLAGRQTRKQLLSLFARYNTDHPATKGIDQ